MLPASSPAPMRVGIYCRVSHDPSGRGTSVADQEKEGRRWCQQNGHEIAWVVVDNDQSASRHARKKDRPGYSRVQQNLAGADPVDILWAWESSRFQRDLEVYVQVRALCERYDVLWSYHGRTYDLSRTDDRFSTGMDALLAERYADETRDRVLRAVRSRVESGKPHGRVPYGYRIVRDEFTGRTAGWEPDPESAPIVQEIVRRVLAGESRVGIARDLERRGVPSPHKLRAMRSGKPTQDTMPWVEYTITRLLKSPTYAGYRTHKGVVVGAEATWPAIISADTHQAVMQLVKQTQDDKTRDRTIKYLLTGIAKCGVCGAWCRALKRDTVSYTCWGGGAGGFCVSRLQYLVDATVEAALMARLNRPDFLKLFQDDDQGEELLNARAELAELEARLEMFRASAERPDGIPVETLARMEATYGPLIEAARLRATPARVPVLVRDLWDATDKYQVWKSYSINQRRSVIKSLFTVTIMPVDARGSHVFDPTKIKIDPVGTKDSGAE